ncbi:TetR/AcrR family transcriptional regulator [Kitasatospora sp. NPDC006697]|uniref:TetR/AcrR family transcriptional regulator n=1 Tax=Kitasatospora sp. NPDC006697 TaxID=3364020 RepID=UPI0036CAAC6A
MRHPLDDGTPAPRRRRRDRASAREQVYDAAVVLFRRKGYADTSIAEIAELAGIGRGTFFNYFRSKDCLVTLWRRDRLNRLATRLDPLLAEADGTAEALRTCMSTLSTLNEEEPDLSAAMLVAWLQTGHPLRHCPYLRLLFADIVEQGRARGEIRSAVDSGRIGETLHDLYFGTLYRWSLPAGEGPRPRLDPELQLGLTLLMQGLVPPPAVALS